MSDWDHLSILQDVASGTLNDAGWRHLRESMRPRICSVLQRSMGHDQLCEDALQEACWRIAKFAKGFRGNTVAAAVAWTMQVATNAARQQAQRNTHRTRMERPSSHIEEAHWQALTATERDNEHDHKLQVIFQEMEALPEQHRIPLTLRYLEGLDNQELARRLGCSYNAAAQRLHRALKAMRQRVLQACPGLALVALDHRLLEITAATCPKVPRPISGGTPVGATIAIAGITSVGLILTAAVLWWSGLLRPALAELVPAPTAIDTAVEGSTDMPGRTQGTPIAIDLRLWNKSGAGRWEQSRLQAEGRLESDGTEAAQKTSLTSPRWMDLTHKRLRYSVTITGPIADRQQGIALGVIARPKNSRTDNFHFRYLVGAESVTNAFRVHGLSGEPEIGARSIGSGEDAGEDGDTSKSGISLRVRYTVEFDGCTLSAFTPTAMVMKRSVAELLGRDDPPPFDQVKLYVRIIAMAGAEVSPLSTTFSPNLAPFLTP